MSTNKKQTTPQNDEGQDTAVAGKDVGTMPKGVNFAAANPGENMDSFVPGKNWTAGQVLAGRYIRTERVYSQKFTAGKKDDQGRKYRDLHVLEDMNTKALFGIWSVGILGNFFNQVPVEAPVCITYKGLGDKPFKEGDSAPHTFDFALGEGYRLQRRGAEESSAQAAH